jgi:hypothetical protein
MSRGLVVAVIAALSFVLVPAAVAGPSLHVGAVEDAAIWGDPGAQMDLARLAGFDTVRMTVQWTSGESAPPPAALGYVRRAALNAVARGIEPVLAVYNADARSTPADAVSRALFVSFLQNVVRAVPEVHTFIVGNEPNTNTYWLPQYDAAGTDVAAAAYEQLLADSYAAIKAIHPGATVVGGALDPHGNDDPGSSKQSHSPTTFIRDLGAAYRASGRAAPLMDVWDEHVYADNSTLPPSMAHPNSSAVGEADYGKLVSLLAAAFDGTAQPGSTLPILYGEFGVESTIAADRAGAYSGAEPASLPTVDEATQAAYYVQAFKLALCQPNVIGILDFHVVDERDLGAWQSGLFYADGTPKSSLAAVSAAAQAARAGTLTPCPDTTPPTVARAAPAADGSVTLTGSDDVGVGGVTLSANGDVVGVRYAAPYSFSWQPPRPGRYVLQARAVDGAGNAGTASLTLAAVHAERGGSSGGSGAWLFGTPPANDLIQNAQVIRGWTGRSGSSTAFATAQPGEPAAGAVWFSWRAPATGRLRFAAAGGRVGVYSGPRLGRLRLEVSRGGVAVQRGKTYRIAVSGARGAFTLAWRRAPAR